MHKTKLRYFITLIALSLSSMFSASIFAEVIIAGQLEIQEYTDITTVFKTKNYENTYTSAPVIVCTYNFISSGDIGNENAAAQVRLNNVSTSSFSIRLQTAITGASITSNTVYCLISAPGTYTSPVPYIAGTVTSNYTQDFNSWFQLNEENVTPSAAEISALGLNNGNITVVGQVITENDPDFVTFWSHLCDNSSPFTNTRGSVPNAQTSGTNYGVCVGKHSGQIDSVSGSTSGHTTEELAYIIGTEGTYNVPGTGLLRIGEGGDSVRGVRDNAPMNSPPFIYTLGDTYEYAVASQTSEAGGNGAWAVLYGPNPITNELRLALDETKANDRKHTKEPVDYWAFKPIDESIVLNVAKTAEVISDPINGTSPNAKMIPGSVVDYSITVINQSSPSVTAPDADSVVISDNIQEGLRLYVGTGDPSRVFSFTDGSAPNQSGLTPLIYSGAANTSDDVQFSANTTGNNWSHVPVDGDGDGYEDTGTTKRVRFSLKGAMNNTSTGNQPEFTVKFSATLD